jgi:hypothetical protein
MFSFVGFDRNHFPFSLIGFILIIGYLERLIVSLRVSAFVGNDLFRDDALQRHNPASSLHAASAGGVFGDLFLPLSLRGFLDFGWQVSMATTSSV